RFYVVDAIADAFVERFVQLSRQIVVGDPRRPETDMGPVISRPALARGQRAIDRARQEGAHLVGGGGRPPCLERGHCIGPRVPDAFREPKHVHIDYIQERKSYWFPYADRKW